MTNGNSGTKQLYAILCLVGLLLGAGIALGATQGNVKANTKIVDQHETRLDEVEKDQVRVITILERLEKKFDKLDEKIGKHMDEG